MMGDVPGRNAVALVGWADCGDELNCGCDGDGERDRLRFRIAASASDGEDGLFPVRRSP